LTELKRNLGFFYSQSRNTNTKLYIKTVSNSEDIGERFVEEYKDICDYIYVEHIIENWPDFEAGASVNSIRYDHEAYAKQKEVCIQPFKLLCVCANGDVVGCCVDWKREILLGNILQSKITEIWNGNTHRELLKSLLIKNSKKPICQKCWYTAQNQPDDIDDSADEILGRLK
jgi:radical SAM protein with 4Fe4S-binding SPASM domain